jgi:hypothetical protein
MKTGVPKKRFLIQTSGKAPADYFAQRPSTLMLAAPKLVPSYVQQFEHNLSAKEGGRVFTKWEQPSVCWCQRLWQD